MSSESAPLLPGDPVFVDAGPVRPWFGWAVDHPDEGAIIVDAATKEDADKIVRHLLNADDPSGPMVTAVRPIAAKDVDQLREEIEKQQVVISELRTAATRVMGGLTKRIAIASRKNQQPPLFEGIAALHEAIVKAGGDA